MASGALPPGFAPVEIDGEHYWDGGIVSNTPLQYVLDQPGKRRRTVFQVDLFAATGALPTRHSRSDRAREGHPLLQPHPPEHHLRTRPRGDRAGRQAAARQAPGRELRDDPDARALAHIRAERAVDVVHLIYRSKHYETQSKDYEFSRLSMQEHWDAGRADMAHTLHDPRWSSGGRATRPACTSTI